METADTRNYCKFLSTIGKKFAIICPENLFAIMILYHGSNVEVREPEILAPSHALDFVCSCRDGFNSAEGRDLVFGPVANDDVYRTLTLYREGEITKEEALVRLKIKQLYNQLVFVTPKALTFIRFRGSEAVV